MATTTQRGRAEELVAWLRSAADAEARQRVAFRTLDAASDNPHLFEAGVTAALVAALCEWEDDDEARSLCATVVGVLVPGDDEKDGGGGGDARAETQAAMAAAGVLEALVPLVPVRDRGNQRQAVFALLRLSYGNAAITQKLRDVPGVLEVLQRADAESGGTCVRTRSLLERVRGGGVGGGAVSATASAAIARGTATAAGGTASRGAGAGAAAAGGGDGDGAPSSSDAGAKAAAFASGSASTAHDTPHGRAVALLRAAKSRADRAEASDLLVYHVVWGSRTLYEAGVVPPLVAGLQYTEEEEFVADCAWVINSLAERLIYDDVRTALVEAGALEALGALFLESYKDIFCDALWHLTHLDPAKMRRLRAVPGVYDALEERLGKESAFYTRMTEAGSPGKFTKAARG